MTYDINSITRRSALKKGCVVTSALAVGLPVLSSAAAANQDPGPNPDLEMIVDLPPVISSKPQGEVVSAIYPGGAKEPADVFAAVENTDGGFRLGPNGPNVEEEGAEAVRWQLLPTGNMGVFFDASTAHTWFTTPENVTDTVTAKLSAVNDEGIIAWGFDEVTVNRDGSEARRF